MQRIEVVIKLLRLITVEENYQRLYTYTEIVDGLSELELSYTTTTDQNGGRHLNLDIDKELTIHFTYENNFYKIPRYNIVHTILNVIQQYYNEMIVENYIDKEQLNNCFKELETVETGGVETWADKQVAVHRVLKLFHEDKIVAVLMFLKYISEDRNQQISYIERHFMPLTYRGFSTDMVVELYNTNYYRMVSLDINNCAIVEEEFDLIVKSFRRWYQK